MSYTVRLIFLCSFLLFCWGCAQKSAKLQRSVVPPDQTLFETGTEFLEKGHYIRSRLALQTMINTYPDSDMTADAYYAIGDSYYEEGGTTNLLQAIQQYQDFIIFFPAHPKAPDAQFKIMSAYGKMVGAADRDQTQTFQALQAGEEFLEMYPNNPLAPLVANHLNFFRDKLAQGEMSTAKFYGKRGNLIALQGRLQTILDKWPNSNLVPEAYFLMAEALSKSTNEEDSAKAEEHYAKLVSEYPFSEFAEKAEQRLIDMGKTVPEVNTKLAEENRAKMREPEGFSPLTPLSDFVKAIGFIGPPDRYEEAQEILRAQEAAKEAEDKAREEKEKEGGFDIEDVITKPASDEGESPKE